MICKVRETLRKFSMCENCDEIIVGFSGGADSTCLIYILNELKEEFNYNIRAAHVNHCLRGEESDRDENFVRDFCQKHSIELEVLKLDVAKGAESASMSIEEYAREVRYQFFDSLCGEKSKIATAHNLNDCEETLILNLTRGSGLKGLCSIPPVRDRIIRPIIECTRDEIEAYCNERFLDFVTDSTNLTNEYTRNRIRHGIIPALKEINPAFDNAVHRCICSLRDDEDFLQCAADELYNKIKTNDGFDSDTLDKNHDALKKRVVARILAENCGVFPEKKHIELVCSILKGGKAEVLCGKTVVVRQGILSFLSDYPNDRIEETEVVFKNGKWSNELIKLSVEADYTQKVYKELVLSTFDYDKIVGNLTLRSRREGDKITLPTRKITKSLKKLFNEMKILPEKRDSILILSDDRGIVWIEKIGCDARVLPQKSSKLFVNVSILGER